MKNIFICLLLVFIITASLVDAQETYFGKNKVRYKDFDWSYIQTRHFDIHFYEDAYETAKFTATVMESSYVEISNELNYKIQKRVPVFVYNSHNDFQQTNILPYLISEGIGGFTEAIKNRVVIPFDGSYEEFRHVLHHELTHAFIYDLLYGNMFSSLLSRRRLFNLPDWFAEGFAEYSSRHGWDYNSDMFVRDATINGYLAPPMYMGGFLAYKEGQALVKYIAETYGEEKLGQILRKGKVYLTMNKALKETIDKTEEELWEDFSKEMKRRYWPEIANRKEPDEIGKQLTEARKDGSYYNEKPVFHPDGKKIAIFTDKSDYTELVLITAKTGKRIKNLVRSARSGDLESLHSYVSGTSFSPDGSQIVFVAKSEGKPTLMFYDIDEDKIISKKTFGFYNILSPKWSPDGNKIAFAALKGSERDLYIYDMVNDTTEKITDGRADDVDPSWFPDSKRLIFSSDRAHPSSPEPDGENHMYVGQGAYLPGDFNYGYYNLFSLNIDDKVIEPLEVGAGQNRTPAVSPDGSKVVFISNRNGIDNLYISYLDEDKVFAITDIITGIRSFSWSPDGKEIAFSSFNKGGYDIFVMDEITPAGENGVLANTAFIEGEYDLLHVPEENSLLANHLDKHNQKVLKPAEQSIEPDYVTYTVDTTMLAVAEDSVTVEETVEEAGEEAASDEESKTDSTITATGIYDEGYVFVSDKKEDKFDSLLLNIPDSDATYPGGITMDEPKSFDSIPEPSEEGDYDIIKYKTKFTPDYVGGGVNYDTFFGLRGQTYFVFTDYLGNHMLYFATDLVNTIDQSNIQAFYFYNKKRTNLGVGLFHSKYYYDYFVDNQQNIFSDRFYGFQGLISYPFSTFSRVELLGSQYFIDREFVDYYNISLNNKRNSKITTAQLSYVTDNIIWGIVGPVNGRRTKISVSGGINLFDSDDIEFTSVEFDFRRYWRLNKNVTFALRTSGGASFGGTPKLYFLGGTTNWIGSRTLDASVYEVENLYFSDVITPLRGLPYYSQTGNRYGLINAEFRFPMIDYFAMRFPLPIVISQVRGVVFSDLGAAWFDDDFKGGTSEGGADRLNDIKVGFGFGMRMNLGFLLLRYDLAWGTDFHNVSDHPTYYFSFGADF